jgi:hypothetical protein
MKTRLLTVVVPLLATVLALAAGEAGLRLAERLGGPRFDGLSTVFAENFFFDHWKPGKPLYPSAALFDPGFGWHAGPRVDSPELVFNAQGWRRPFDYRPGSSGKRRIALIGDSFTYGSHLTDRETIAAQLESLLGDRYEVLVFAAEGFGLDQMAVLTDAVVPGYHPDAVIVGFIADDLRRSCTRFAWGQARKPYFELTSAGLELRGVPVPPPEQNALRHRRWQQRLTDSVLALAVRSRVLNAIASPWTRWQERSCLSSLNPALIRRIAERTVPASRLLVAHLYGDLPPGFPSAVTGSFTYLDYPSAEPALARRWRLTPGTSDGYHPDAVRARLIAIAYRDWLLSDAGAASGRSLSRITNSRSATLGMPNRSSP